MRGYFGSNQRDISSKGKEKAFCKNQAGRKDWLGKGFNRYHAYKLLLGAFDWF